MISRIRKVGLWEDNTPLDDLVRLFTHFQGEIQRIGRLCGVAMPIGRLLHTRGR